MINSTPKFQKRKLVTTLFILLLLSVVVYFYRNSQPVAFVQGFVQSLFSVPKSTLYAVGKNENVSADSLIDRKIREMEKKIVDYQILKQDNEALKNQFNSYGETSLNLTAAKIIGFQGEGRTPNEFIINVGRKNKIENGMSVVVDRHLVGKIIIVSQNYSVAITPFHPDFKVLAKFPETNANGILVGQDDLMLLNGVVITDTLKQDGIIVTKGEVNRLGIGVVPDLILGKIESISKNETAPFQGAQIAPLIDYGKLTNVFVIAQM